QVAADQPLPPAGGSDETPGSSGSGGARAGAPVDMTSSLLGQASVDASPAQLGYVPIGSALSHDNRPRNRQKLPAVPHPQPVRPADLPDAASRSRGRLPVTTMERVASWLTRGPPLRLGDDSRRLLAEFLGTFILTFTHAGLGIIVQASGHAIDENGA